MARHDRDLTGTPFTSAAVRRQRWCGIWRPTPPTPSNLPLTKTDGLRARITFALPEARR